MIGLPLFLVCFTGETEHNAIAGIITFGDTESLY